MTEQEAKQKSTHFLNLFMQVRKKFQECKLEKNGDDVDYAIYFIGNKTVGSDYALNTWKTVPILECRVHQYSPSHPIYPGQFFPDLRLNYTGSQGSEDFKMSDERFIEKCTKAFNRCKQDFLTNEI